MYGVWKTMEGQGFLFARKAFRVENFGEIVNKNGSFWLLNLCL